MFRSVNGFGVSERRPCRKIIPRFPVRLCHAQGMSDEWEFNPDEEETALLCAAVEEALRCKESVPHEIVREWLLALARGERPPPPLPPSK